MEKDISISPAQAVSRSPTVPFLPALLRKAAYSYLTAHVLLTLDEDEDTKSFYLRPMGTQLTGSFRMQINHVSPIYRVPYWAF